MKHAFRVHYNRCREEESFEKHLEFVGRYLDVIDEITIITEFSHYGYWEDYRENAARIGHCIEQYRVLGVRSVGIDLMSTIGHAEEGWDVFPRADLQYNVSRDGIESKSCLCPSNERFLDYIGDRYTEYAKAGPDFIWFDDDVRIFNHGQFDVCYCPECIGRFNRENHTEYDFANLTRRLNDDKELQKEWYSFRVNVLRRLVARIRDAVKAVNPAIRIGLMGVGPEEERSLLEESGAMMCRPGGGFYDEDVPGMLFKKAFNVGRQIQEYPPQIKDIQYEYEGLDFVPYGKSVHMTEMECTASLMYGCNGILYLQFLSQDQPQLPEMIRHSKAKWDFLCRINQDAGNKGVFCSNWTTSLYFNELGLPVTSSIEHACAAVVLGDEWTWFSREKVERILQCNVLTDGAGVEALHRMGLGERCGASVTKAYSNGMAERFTDHPLNGGYAGHYRDVYMNTLGTGTCHGFAVNSDAEILAMLETITHIPQEKCSMYLYEAPSGERFAANGYLQVNRLRSEAKRTQLVNAFEWLSGGKLPLKIDKCVKVVPVVRENRCGTVSIMLANASFDATGNFSCVVQGKRCFFEIGDEGGRKPVRQRTEDGRTVLDLDGIRPWHYLLLVGYA